MTYSYVGTLYTVPYQVTAITAVQPVLGLNMFVSYLNEA